MSELRSAVTELTAVDPDRLSPTELAEGVVELSHVGQMIEVLRTRWVRSLTDRGGHTDLGYSSPTAFLTDTTRMSAGHAKQAIGWANMDEKAPLAFSAWADGRISTDQARHLFHAAEGVPDVFPEAEQLLVEAVEGLDATDTRRTIEYWRQTVDGPGQLDAETQWARRGVSLSKSIGGMHKIDGWLTETAGQALEAALDANTPPRTQTDTRTPRQRRHDALENLCRDWLDNGATPQVGGERPHISLHTDLHALQGVAGGLHETETGHIVDIDTLRMVACDCAVTRIVFGPESEVLDTGRKTRIWSPAQRRAIIARDRHCQGKGCKTKPRHCDIHHQDHWADGGTTTVESGKLLCRPCHTLEHLKDKHRRRRQSRT